MADAERGSATDDGFEDEAVYVVKHIDVSAMTPSERRVQRLKDCFWDFEAMLARWFGVDDSRYAFELALKEEEDAKIADAAAREEQAREKLATIAAEGIEMGGPGSSGGA